MPSLVERLRSLPLGRRVSRFCALDFDSRQLRIAQADGSGERVRILKLATADMPPGIDLADAQAVGAFLGRTLSQMRLRGRAVVMNVPRGQAVLKPVTLPPVASAGELARMVQYQSEKEFTFRPDEAVIDFTLESHYGAEPTRQDQPQGEHVLVAAVQRTVIEYYQKVAEAAGVRLLRLGLRPYADMRCVETFGGVAVQGRLAIIHVTADETEIDVVEEGGLTFSRSAVVKVPPATEGDEAVVAEAAQTVVAEVARSLHSYMAVERGQKIEAILVAGGTGIEPQVAAELGRRLSVRSEIFSPAAHLGLEETGAAASAFLSALGLAAGQAGGAAMPFDFLHPKRPSVQRDRGRLMTIGAGVGAAMVLVGAFGVSALHLYNADAAVGSLTRQLNKLAEENHKVAAQAKHVEDINAWVRMGRDWLDQWAYLSSVFPSCTETYVTGLKANPDASFGFTVKAKSNEAVNELGKRLAAAGYEFKPGQVATGADPYGYVYSTSVKVIVKPDMKVDLAGATPVPRPEDDASADLFGRPPSGGRSEASRTSESSPPPPAAASAPAESPSKEWRAKMDALYRERPPSSQEAARKEWNARLEALMKQRPPEPAPPSSSHSGKHR